MFFYVLKSHFLYTLKEIIQKFKAKYKSHLSCDANNLRYLTYIYDLYKILFHFYINQLTFIV